MLRSRDCLCSRWGAAGGGQHGSSMSAGEVSVLAGLLTACLFWLGSSACNVHFKKNLCCVIGEMGRGKPW